MSEVGEGQKLYRGWYSSIMEALKRESTFRKQGKKCVELYEARHPEKVPFSILYSNTETFQPAVYNSRPIPYVDRRFKDADPVGKLAADVATRLLKFLVDAESADYDNYDELMQPAVLDALVTNRGVTEFKYEADTDNGKVENECVYGEAVRWDKFFHGYARTWKKVPWIGFEYDMDEGEAKKNFPEVADKLSFENLQDSDEEDVATSSGETKEERTGVKLAKVWKIWDKPSRRVYFFSPIYKDGALKTVEDPFGLSGFFPMPKPLNFMKKISTLVPTPLYIQYEQQAKELNEITIRLKNIVKALKVRGFYNSTIQGIEKVLEAEDNVLIPAENMVSMPDNSGLDKTIWLMPLDNLAAVAVQLSQQREQCKQVIYEITGVSDILRGASIASETATAQNIKNQWGTLRLKKMQKEVQRYCRDCLRIMLEIAATKLSQETVQGMTGLQLPTQAQKDQVKAQIQQIMAQFEQAQAMQPPPQPGQPPAQPPQPPQIPPELEKILATPSWEDVLGVLKDDTTRSYKVDIETNSTIDAEASQDKQDISELLNALSQFMNGLAPLIEQGVMPFEVAKQVLLTIARRYTFGPQLEDALNQMKAPEPQKEDDGKAQVAAAQNQAIQMQAQADQATAQLTQQKIQMEMQRDAIQAERDKEASDLEHKIRIVELQYKMEAARQNSEQNAAKHAAQIAVIQAKAAAASVSKPPSPERKN